jgi:hypothetical protein
VSPLPRNSCKSWSFSVQTLYAPCCCPHFSAGKCTLLVNLVANVSFTNGQTVRILVPYSGRPNLSSESACQPEPNLLSTEPILFGNFEPPKNTYYLSWNILIWVLLSCTQCQTIFAKVDNSISKLFNLCAIYFPSSSLRNQFIIWLCQIAHWARLKK